MSAIAASNAAGKPVKVALPPLQMHGFNYPANGSKEFAAVLNKVDAIMKAGGEDDHKVDQLIQLANSLFPEGHVQRGAGNADLIALTIFMSMPRTPRFNQVPLLPNSKEVASALLFAYDNYLHLPRPDHMEPRGKIVPYETIQEFLKQDEFKQKEMLQKTPNIWRIYDHLGVLARTSNFHFSFEDAVVSELKGVYSLKTLQNLAERWDAICFTLSRDIRAQVPVKGPVRIVQYV